MTGPRARAVLGARLLLLTLLAGCPGRRDVRGFAEPPADGTTVRDAVDGATCVKTPLSESAIFEGKTYYFCGPSTAADFRKTPEKHADPGPPAA